MKFGNDITVVELKVVWRCECYSRLQWRCSWNANQHGCCFVIAENSFHHLENFCKEAEDEFSNLRASLYTALQRRSSTF